MRYQERKYAGAGRWTWRTGCWVLGLALCAAMRLRAETAPAAAPSPSFAFAVIADVQYGNKDAQGPRDYRNALPLLEQNVDEFNRRKPVFVVQLGDLTDGYAHDAAASVRDLDTITKAFSRLSRPLYHVVGNHDLYAGTEILRTQFGLKSFHYEFRRAEAPGWLFVVLDGNAESPYALGEAQRRWLSEVLSQADEAGERALIFCHFPVWHRGLKNVFLKDGSLIADLIGRHRCVVAWFAGHDHSGGYVEKDGVHFVTLKGLVENTDKNAWAWVDVFADRLEVRGQGAEPSRTLLFRKRSP